MDTYFASRRYLGSCITSCIALNNFSDVNVSKWSLRAVKIVCRTTWKHELKDVTVAVCLCFLGVRIMITKHGRNDCRCPMINCLVHAQQTTMCYESSKHFVSQEVLLRQPPGYFDVRWQVILNNRRLIFPKHSVGKFCKSIDEQLTQGLGHVSRLNTWSHAYVNETKFTSPSNKIFQVLYRNNNRQLRIQLTFDFFIQCWQTFLLVCKTSAFLLTCLRVYDTHWTRYFKKKLRKWKKFVVHEKNNFRLNNLLLKL